MMEDDHYAAYALAHLMIGLFGILFGLFVGWLLWA